MKIGMEVNIVRISEINILIFYGALFFHCKTKNTSGGPPNPSGIPNNIFGP
jgi:hypothetical protein